MNKNNAYQFLTGNNLKLIAAFSMLLDHFAIVVLKGYVNVERGNIAEQTLEYWNIIYVWLRRFGRMAFPLFAFLLVEGFFYTKSRLHYLKRILIMAIASEVIYDLATTDRFFDWGKQNTLFTLGLGLIVLCLFSWISKRESLPKTLVLILQCSICAIAMYASVLCKLDYDWRGVLLIAAFYFFHSYQWATAIAGFCVFSYRPWSMPAFLLIPFYNGRRKNERRLNSRWFGRWFYLFYPFHLLVLYACKCIWISL